jgi:hypothetical protein
MIVFIIAWLLMALGLGLILGQILRLKSPEPPTMCTSSRRLCRHVRGTRICGATSPSGYTCVREDGHLGLHVACGPGEDQHNYAVWTREET